MHLPHHFHLQSSVVYSKYQSTPSWSCFFVYSWIVITCHWVVVCIQLWTVWKFGIVVASFNEVTIHWARLILGWVTCLQVYIPPGYVIKPTRATQPCILLGSLNQTPALIGWDKGGNVTSVGWQVKVWLHWLQSAVLHLLTLLMFT